MSYNLTSKRFYNQESQSMVSSSAKMKSNSKKRFLVINKLSMIKSIEILIITLNIGFGTNV